MKQKIVRFAVICWLLLFGCEGLFAQTNLLDNYNPGFESGLGLWNGSGFQTVSVDTGNPGEGTTSAKQPATPGGPWNTLVNTAIIPVASGKSYVLSVLTRHNLAGGNALFALAELNSSKVVTRYQWKTTSNSSSWHSESLILTPQATTSYLKVYFQVDANASSGAAWWDGCRLYEVNSTSMTTATTNPFTDDSNAAADIAPLPVSTFTKSGSTVTPSALVPAVNIGTLMVGGTLSWKVVAATAGPNGTAILEDYMIMSETGLYAWTVDLQAASLPVGKYLLVIDLESRDGTILRKASKPFSIQ